MRREYYIYVGLYFIFLIYNFLTRENNWYRNSVILTMVIGYGLIAIDYHLHKNGKI